MKRSGLPVSCGLLSTSCDLAYRRHPLNLKGRPMKKFGVLAAFVLGIAFAQQAGACEWMHQVANPATVVTCDNGTCTTEQATQEAAAKPEPAPAQTAADEPATPPATAVLVAHAAGTDQ
jgi:hypothetical protein